jgi:glutamate:Na+ symporter, ESS family
MLLIGVVLRAKIKPIQKYLFPSCLVGGLIGMTLLNTKVIDIDFEEIKYFAWHLFNISFISVGLTGSDKKEKERGQVKKEIAKGASWMALVQGICFPLQGLVGFFAVIIFGLFGVELFHTFGFLCPLGFNEGPGQALSIGKTWEGYGFQNASTIGLTFASVGFFFAFFVGVPLANWGLRKNLAAHGDSGLSSELLAGIMKRNQDYESAGSMTVHPSNIDNLAFQAAFIGLIYIITYVFVKGLGSIIGGDTASHLWAFFFFFGLFIAILLKAIMDKIGIGYLIDQGVQKRITGWSVDFLIVATIAGIKIEDIWPYILPITAICLVAGVGTTLVVIFFGKRLWENNLERSLAIYGCVTGNVSSGLLLLRIVDPEFKTTAAKELGFMNLIVVPFILTGTYFITAVVGDNPSITTTHTALVFAAMMIISLVLLKLTKFWGEKKF